METVEIENKLSLGNFTIILAKDSEAIVLTTTPTEQNNGGQTLTMLDPLHDRMTYATIRQLFDMAVEEDEIGKQLLTNYCVALFAVRSATIVDMTMLDDVVNATRNQYARVKAKTDEAGAEAGIKEETSEEALAKLKEDEDLLTIVK